MNKFYILLLVSFFFISCKTNKVVEKKTTESTKIRFIGEQIIPANAKFNDTKIGGLSSIDFVDGKYYLISDDKDKPIRFYEMKLTFNAQEFSEIEITNVIKIENDSKGIDPEALRFDKSSGNFIWTSEGHIRKGISPAIFEVTKNGVAVRTIPTPKILQVTKDYKKTGPRRNGTFEGLSMSSNPNYFWVGMELPLKQDGEEPQLEQGNYPVRISKINKKTGALEYQFVYQLDAIPRDSKPSNKFIVNGLPEILEVAKNQFLFVERAYASGHKDGGNTVKIYKVDCTKATDVSNIESLKTTNYQSAIKTEVFNFENIRSKLTNGIVDNIEGITFGPKLSNGNRTLIVVSDNNFNKFSTQLSQVIVLEIRLEL